MAYAANVTVTSLGGRKYSVLVEESEASSSTEATINLPFTSGILLSQAADKISGSASTIDPVLSTATNSTLSIETVFENGTAAATISNLLDPQRQFFTPIGQLFHKSKCDGVSTDNTVKTLYLFMTGW